MTEDSFDFLTETRSTETGWGNDLINADDVMGVGVETEVESYPDVAGMFRDTAEGETANDRYSNFNFTVDWGDGV